ncbi:unnamed protein product [Zymoseptoria tritici ST99CH_1A5]|uniref:poly(ADP-ribose) glycohydrolase n=2 Tax=Zymoseptoria tritici TaxID=1047171 RepID=F9X825_ZYMTI|nr:uncharacterized protein MYCGRDRAFT_92214 [Zymoseptoria tritici IPO323]EGP89117.1 hypothetical protein MYCGRDRAFT_92214 [Zymoseptoria tritici IPO323]SMY23161.1 unnamed protein product [Zymoseptoria tritici ST99CH_1A5]
MSTEYTLPCSPKYLCEDRFSILDSDELQVPFWPVFAELLKQPTTTPTQVIDLLETIAVTLRQKSSTDYGFLRDFMRTKLAPDFFSRTWPSVVDLSLQLPVLFPICTLPILSAGQASLQLTRRQAACLVTHQFLCTLAAPTWQDGYQDFHIWYSAEQPHARAVDAYLTALFKYFDRLGGPAETTPLSCSAEVWPITYTLTDNDEPANHAAEYLIPFETQHLDAASTAPFLLGLPDGASVISANKFIGFGRTGTQDEVHVGCSPEACPAVLVTPPLGDGDVMVVVGAEAMITIEGYGRTAQCGEVLPPPLSENAHDHRELWSKRTMLFMDALELDLEGRDEGLPDLQPGKVERELRKAYTAFRSSQNTSSGQRFNVVNTGFWGCRTFGGNPSVKTMIQWCAASKAGCGSMEFICSGEEQEAFGKRMMLFVDAVRMLRVKTTVLESVLLELLTQDVSPGEDALDVVLVRLKAKS